MRALACLQLATACGIGGGAGWGVAVGLPRCSPAAQVARVWLWSCARHPIPELVKPLLFAGSSTGSAASPPFDIVASNQAMHHNLIGPTPLAGSSTRSTASTSSSPACASRTSRCWTASLWAAAWASACTAPSASPRSGEGAGHSDARSSGGGGSLGLGRGRWLLWVAPMERARGPGCRGASLLPSAWRCTPPSPAACNPPNCAEQCSPCQCAPLACTQTWGDHSSSPACAAGWACTSPSLGPA